MNNSRLKRFLILAVLLILPFSVSNLSAQGKDDGKKNAKPANPALRLKVGDMAPDFTMLSFDGKDLKKISLRDFRGKKSVALAFYVFAFTGG